MKHRSFVAAAASAFCAAATACAAAPPPVSETAVNQAGFTPLPDTSSERIVPEVVKAQVLLDRARFSPGAVDGIDGENFRHALTAYQVQIKLPVSGRLDQATWDKLTAGTPAPLKTVEVTKHEADGPFTEAIPAEFEAQARMSHMGYRDIREALGERYHMSQTLLMALNPGSRLKAGERIVVADVDGAKPTDAVARIVVDKAGHDVEALAVDGRLIAFYPASIGSTDKPAPTGDFTIHHVDHDPVYTYDPAYHFKGVSAKKPFSIAAGPNNPVGLVWMDLGGDGYGIHGTPDPDTVGKTQSHGCIRMTNWDALDLAAMVKKGTSVSFGDTRGSDGPVAPPPQPSASAGADAMPGSAAIPSATSDLVAPSSGAKPTP